MPRLLPTLALGLLCACGHPTDVAIQFHDALAKGDGAKAYALLSKPTQEKLARIAKAAHDVSGGTVSDDPAEMIAHGDNSIYALPTASQPHVARVSMISSEGPRAKVSVHIGESTHEMDLVREGGRWRIDLPLGSP